MKITKLSDIINLSIISKKLKQDFSQFAHFMKPTTNEVIFWSLISLGSSCLMFAFQMSAITLTSMVLVPAISILSSMALFSIPKLLQKAYKGYKKNQDLHPKTFESFEGVPEFKKLIEKADKEMPLLHGPLMKSKSTEDFEYIVKQLLRNKESTFLNKNNECWIKIAKKNFNLSQILNKAYLQHLVLDNEDFKLYEANFGKKYYFNLSVNQLNSDLHPAQKDVIDAYKGSGYRTMQSFLSKDFKRFNFGLDSQNKATLIKAMIQSAILTTALNKRYPHGPVPKYCVRGETTFSEEILQSRKNLAKKNGISYSNRFTSTSKSSRFSFRGDVKIIYTDVVGRDISSLNPYESEFLMPPTQIRWIKAYDKHNHAFFLAQPVATPMYEVEDIQENKIAAKAKKSPRRK